MSVRLLALAASLRQGSHNRRLLTLAARVAEEGGASVTTVALADVLCPPYDFDAQQAEGIPPQAERLGELLREHDGLLLASPEYNYSFPGHLKNAIDWVSRIRPVPCKGRWGLLLAASPSLTGGSRGLWQLRVPLECLGMFLHPEMFALASADKAFADDGSLRDAALQRRLEGLVASFTDVVGRARAA